MLVNDSGAAVLSMALALGVPLTLSVGISALGGGTTPGEAEIENPDDGTPHRADAEAPEGDARPYRTGQDPASNSPGVTK